MNLLKGAVTLILLGLGFAFASVSLLAMGKAGPVSTVLLITSLYVVLGGMGLVVLGTWLER